VHPPFPFKPQLTFPPLPHVMQVILQVAPARLALQAAQSALADLSKFAKQLHIPFPVLLQATEPAPAWQASQVVAQRGPAKPALQALQLDTAILSKLGLQLHNPFPVLEQASTPPVGSH